MERSGGGALMDLGCHGIAFCYWFLGRQEIQTVYCQMGTHVHGDKTRGDDDTLCILEFANGAVGMVENSWGRRGGMDDRIEVYGSGGVTYANLTWGTLCRHTAKKATGTRWKRRPARRDGVTQYSRSYGTTGIRRRWRISRAAFAEKKSRRRPAKMVWW
ncbi:MAG TPA: Gfo/Idh/MocA family oxidoreductase [Candidatus Acidoferrum sp.]|nr:Gfo/Idh/MocA family oxidoreductase [Candidatus Acidoferrum sp.]